MRDTEIEIYDVMISYMWINNLLDVLLEAEEGSPVGAFLVEVEVDGRLWAEVVEVDVEVWAEVVEVDVEGWWVDVFEAVDEVGADAVIEVNHGYYNRYL